MMHKMFHSKYFPKITQLCSLIPFSVAAGMAVVTHWFGFNWTGLKPVYSITLNLLQVVAISC